MKVAVLLLVVILWIGSANAHALTVEEATGLKCIVGGEQIRINTPQELESPVDLNDSLDFIVPFSEIEEIPKRFISKSGSTVYTYKIPTSTEGRVLLQTPETQATFKAQVQVKYADYKVPYLRFKGPVLTGSVRFFRMGPQPKLESTTLARARQQIEFNSITETDPQLNLRAVNIHLEQFLEKRGIQVTGDNGWSFWEAIRFRFFSPDSEWGSPQYKTENKNAATFLKDYDGYFFTEFSIRCGLTDQNTGVELEKIIRERLPRLEVPNEVRPTGRDA